MFHIGARTLFYLKTKSFSNFEQQSAQTHPRTEEHHVLSSSNSLNLFAVGLNEFASFSTTESDTKQTAERPVVTEQHKHVNRKSLDK